MDKLEKIRPTTTGTYEVQMVGEADTPTGKTGTWRYVEIVGINVSTGQKEGIRVGKVCDH